VGDPRAASSELGEAILDASADALASLLDVVATRDTTRPSSRSD
jgi:creatinine amidohydrolase/Fe(II)-dependent formamide hydrolase-like protein